METLLFGIITDTNVLRNKAAHSSTFRVVSEITATGINFYSLQQEYLVDKKVSDINCWGIAFKRLRESANKAIAWTYIMQADLGTQDVSCLEGLNDFLNSRLQTDITILVKELPASKQAAATPVKTKLSVRTKMTDANKLAKSIAAHIGNTTGGGHSMRAGIQSKEPVHVVIKKIASYS